MVDWRPGSVSCGTEVPFVHEPSFEGEMKAEAKRHNDIDIDGANRFVREQLQELLGDWIKPDQGKLVRHAVYSFRSLVADRWRDGRIFPMGDAGHVMSPFVRQDWFEGLPEEVRTAMREAADETKAWYLNDLETAAETALVEVEKLGATVSEAPPEMRQEWAASMENAAATWTETLDAQGKPASEVLSRYMDAMREAGAEPLRDWDKE